MIGRAPPGARLTAELLGDLAVAPDPGGAPMVAPVIHDDLERDLEMLRVTVERYGGVWLRADAPEPSVGTPAAELVTATKQVFARFGLQVDIVVGDRIEVRPEGGGRADESLQALHRVAERLLSDEVRTRPMAVVSFSDVGLDARRRELLWALTVQQIPPLLSGAVRLFVPVCAGDVDVPLHCTGEPSLRYAIRRGALHARRGSESLAAAVGRIVRDPDEPLVLFLGAGFSASARLSLGDAVRDDAIASVLNRDPGSEDLLEAFRRWVLDQPTRLMNGEAGLRPAEFAARLTLERVLREEFRDLREEGRPRADSPVIERISRDCETALDRWPEARLALHELADLMPKLVVLMVNFDELVERDAPVDVEVFTPGDGFAGAADAVTRRMTDGGGRLPAVKLHGTIADPETLVADVTVTRLGLPDAAVAVLDALVTAGAPRTTLVFIGCSMRDVDVNEWLRNQNGGVDLFEWWVDPLPGTSFESFVEANRRTEDEERVVDFVAERLLTETADAFLTALRDHVRALRSRPAGT